ncbi:hypothetical protein D3H55_14500 [Bacillus salacetis]|uniref:Uncharacterized protein n=1 Tax=Bacillus salacetis TaxID=2315464 RepID=A0A3A1QXH8_9BACI|nr:hypothetical protein [Bacillus salacetis]RIW31833.1 hypothetical protein D3H55_14500 [Bacillus salacetis]
MKEMPKMKMIASAVFVLLLMFQSAVLAARSYDVYLVYGWIFFINNYLLIFLLLFLLPWNNVYVKWGVRGCALALIVANTTFFYYFGNTNVLVSKPASGEHALILKEYKNLRYETISLKPFIPLFGRATDVLEGSADFKAIENSQYKVEWVSGDTAVLSYRPDKGTSLAQTIFNFRGSDYVRYQYVLVSLTGKWKEEDNPENYFIYDQGEIVYANNGELYYYGEEETEQQGIFSLIVNGNESKPSFTIVLNDDAEYEESGLLEEGSTITISPVSLDEEEGKVYHKN